MVETAAHLVDYVIPRVPVRQWVLTVPKRVRYFLQHDQRIFSGVLRVFMRAVNTAVRKHSPGAPRGAKFGAVTFLHRAGSFLNEHPHMHSEVTDGVFAADEGGQVEFYPAAELTPEVVQNLQQTLRTRILRYIERHGRLDPSAIEDMLEWDHEGGFSLDASVRIDEWDRDALERLSRYTGEAGAASPLRPAALRRRAAGARRRADRRLRVAQAHPGLSGPACSSTPWS